jgi:hypothetical protein
MSVEQQDVHLLDNAFCCYQDDFRPRVANIGKTENVNLPAVSVKLTNNLVYYH